MAAAARSIDDDLTSAKCVQITHSIEEGLKKIDHAVSWVFNVAGTPFVIFGSPLSVRGNVLINKSLFYLLFQDSQKINK